MTPNFNKGDLRKALLKKVEGFNQAVLMALQRAGEQFVADARSVNTYTDQTGNLRSSIGYVILKDGQQLFTSMPGEKPDGVKNAKAVIELTEGKFPSGYVLIVVAGMEYAAAVESKGYDVLTGSAPAAEAMLKKAMERLQKKADAFI